jgi:alcohol dehydrogenase class IV
MGLAGDEPDDLAVERLIAELKALNRDLETPSPSAFGINADKWRRLLPTMAMQALESGSPTNNPRVPSADEIQMIYQEVWS